MPTDPPIMTIAYIDSWVVIDLRTMEVLSEYNDTYEDALEYIKTRAFRVQQGWAP